MLTLQAIKKFLLICFDPCGILRPLSDAEECPERNDVHESELRDSVVFNIRLGAHQYGCRSAGIALGALRLSLCAVDVPPCMAEREVPGFLGLVGVCG